MQPVIKQNTEPGKAPPTPVADTERSRRDYVLMERDLGNRRRPAALIFIGSTIIFLVPLSVLAPPREACGRQPQRRHRGSRWNRSDRGCDGMGQYLAVVLLLVLGILFASGSFITNKIMVKGRPNAAKVAPYECGIVPTKEPPERFGVGFYLVAMLFIMFDIEIVFLYPYVVTPRRARRVRVLGDHRLQCRVLRRRSCTWWPRVGSTGGRCGPRCGG